MYGTIAGINPPTLGDPPANGDIVQNTLYKSELTKRKRKSPDSVPDGILAEAEIKQIEVTGTTLIASIFIYFNLFFCALSAC
jgi:hypothetical protein